METKGLFLNRDSSGQPSRRQSCPRMEHHFSNASTLVDCRIRLEDGRDESRRLFAQNPTYELSLQHNDHVLTSRLLLPIFRLRTQVLMPRSLLPTATLVSGRQSTPRATPTTSGNTTFLLLIMVFQEESSVPG